MNIKCKSEIYRHFHLISSSQYCCVDWVGHALDSDSQQMATG